MKPRIKLMAAASLLLTASCQNAPADAESVAEPQQAALVLPASTPIASAENACMITGTFNIMGREIPARDCVQITDSRTVAELQRHCGELAQAPAHAGGQPGTIEYLDSCPTPAQGSCLNYMGSGFDAYYYERDPADIPMVSQSCGATGGRWQG